MRTLRERFQFFHTHGASWVGHAAEQAIALARAEMRAEREGAECRWEDELEPWDADEPAPAYLFCAIVEHAGEVASLGMVGVNSLRDPYLRVVTAELFAEVFERVDAYTAKLERNARAGLPESVRLDACEGVV